MTPPYRSPEVEAPAERPRAMEFSWRDAENPVNPMRVATCFSLGLVALTMLGRVHLALGAAACVLAWAYGVKLLREMRRVSVVRLEMVSDAVRVVRVDGTAECFELSSIRDVEMESKEIRRVAYTQQVGDAMPSTNLSGDVGVKRMVLVLDDPARRELVTQTYESASHCTEQFGKVRVFLRRNGWLPVDERDARGQGLDQRDRAS